jgi:hypothetical protein
MEGLNKDFLQYLVELGEQIRDHQVPKTHEIDGRLYLEKQGNLAEVYEPRPSTIQVASLKAIVEYLAANPDNIGHDVFVHVLSPTQVEVIGPEFGHFRQRDTYVKASCGALLPALTLNLVMDQEAFIIMIKSAFLDTPERKTVLDVASKISSKVEAELVDDGVGQTVNIQKSNNRVLPIELPPTVTLAPYRTFYEVEQPASEFILRVTDGPGLKLIEADGGAWKMQAVNSVQAWLENELETYQVEKAKVIA